MINGRPIHPFLKVAVIVVIGYVLLSQLIHYALLPVAVGLVVWGGYQILKAERRGIPQVTRRSAFPARRTKRPSKTVETLRLDPKTDLTVPKDWR